MDVEKQPVDQTGATTARAIALSALIADVKAKKGRIFQGGVAMGELRETAELVHGAGQKVIDSCLEFCLQARHAINNITHGQPKAFRVNIRRLNALVTELYLEWTYGVKPLVKDLNDIVESANAFVAIQPRDTVKVRGKGVYVAQGTSSTYNAPVVTGFTSPGAFTNRATKRKVLTHKYRFYGCFDVTLADKSRASVMGFDPIRDFVPTVWELIPYSFVVDYFSNLGSCLEAWSSRFSSVRWINESRRSELKVDYFCPPIVGSDSSYSWNHTGGKASCFVTSVSRLPVQNPAYLTWTLPLNFTAPGWLSTKWLNLAALVNAASLPRPDLRRSSS